MKIEMFSVTGEETLRECKTFNLNQMKLVNQDGIVKYKEYLSGLNGVSVIGLTNDGCIPLVVQHRVAIDRVTLEIPGGKIEPNESPVQAAARELREETGYFAEAFIKMTVLHPAGGYSSERSVLYFATNLAKIKPGDDTEESNVEFVSLDMAVTLCMNGSITDSKTIAAIFMLKQELESECQRKSLTEVEDLFD